MASGGGSSAESPDGLLDSARRFAERVGLRPWEVLSILLSPNVIPREVLNFFPSAGARVGVLSSIVTYSKRFAFLTHASFDVFGSESGDAYPRFQVLLGARSSLDSIVRDLWKRGPAADALSTLAVYLAANPETPGDEPWALLEASLRGQRLEPEYEWARELAVEGRAADSPIGLVSAGVVGIKRFVDGGPKLPDVRGGSILVSRVLVEAASAAAGESGVNPHSLIYIGGGRLLFFSPAERAESLANALRREMSRRTMRLIGGAESAEYEVEIPATSAWTRIEPGEAFEEAYRRLAVEFRERRLDHSDFTGGILLGEDACSVCGVRPKGESRSGSDRDLLCDTCTLRREEGRAERILRSLRAAGQVNLDEIESHLPEFIAGGSYGEVEGVEVPEPYLAIIKADGNGFGALFARPRSPRDLMFHSAAVERALSRAVWKIVSAVERASSGESSVEELGWALPPWTRRVRWLGYRLVLGLVYCDGDDLFWFVPAFLAPHITLKIMEEFSREMERLGVRKPGQGDGGHVPTITAAVLAFKPKAPIYIASAIVDSMLKRAKERTRSEEWSGSGDWGEFRGAAWFDILDTMPPGVHAHASRWRAARELGLTSQPLILGASDGRDLARAVRSALLSEGQTHLTEEELRSLRSNLISAMELGWQGGLSGEDPEICATRAWIFALRQAARLERERGAWERVAALVRPERVSGDERPSRVLDGLILVKMALSALGGEGS